MPGTIEVVRPVGAGRRPGARRRGRGARAPTSSPAGRPLRAQDLGLLAAAGVTEVRVHAAPARGDRVDRRRGRRPRHRAARRRPGPRRQRASRSPRSCATPAASPTSRGIVPDDRERARRGPARRGRAQRRRRRLGRLVGRRARRDRRRRRRAGDAGDLGPRDRASGPASRRCWPTAAASRSSGCRATRARRWSSSAWSAMPVVRLVGGVTRPAGRAVDPRPARARRAVGRRAARRRPGRRARRRGRAAVRRLGAAVGPQRRRRLHRRRRTTPPGCQAGTEVDVDAVHR